jgi:hypothetical protein
VAANDLTALQQELHENPYDTDLQARVADKRLLAFRLAEAEGSFCSQQAKGKFLMNSDRGTHFIYIMRRNTSGNHIAAIVKPDGQQTTSQEQVAAEFIQFYKLLLGSSSSCKPIDIEVVGLSGLSSFSRFGLLPSFHPVSFLPIFHLFLVHSQEEKRPSLVKAFSCLMLSYLELFPVIHL